MRSVAPKTLEKKGETKAKVNRKKTKQEKWEQK